MINEQIANIVSKLDYNWFLRIKKEFESSDKYNKKHDIIRSNYIEIIPIYNKEDQKKEKYDTITTEFIFDLNSYAMNNIVPNSGTNQALLERNLQQISGIELCSLLHKNIDAVLVGFGNKSKMDLLIEYGKQINIAFSKLEETQKDKIGYIDTLEYLRGEMHNYLDNYYSNIIQSTEDILKNTGFLKFDLKQNELATLILLLEEAGFFANQETKMSISNFAKKHFVFKGDENNDYIPAKYIDNKIRDILSGEIKFDDLLDDVFDALSTAKDKLKEKFL
jgi:hypothetical protein